MQFLKHEKDICADWLFYLHNGIVIRFDAEWFSNEELQKEIQEFKTTFFEAEQESWDRCMSKEEAEDIVQGFSMIDFVAFVEEYIEGLRSE